MSVDLNYSNRTSQLISINTEIVQSWLMLNFANQEQHEIRHHVIQSTAEAARGISFQGFLKLKEKEKLLPTFETFQSSGTEQRQISKCSPKLSSWNYTSSWGNLPIRESSCIMNWGVTQCPCRYHCSLLWTQAPKPVRADFTDRADFTGVNWPYA